MEIDMQFENVISQSLDKNARKLRSRIFRHMVQTRGWKYRSFLRYLRIFKYVAFAPIRGEFLESYYVLMRSLDDIVDGDLPLPPGYKNSIDYISDKISFSQNMVNPRDEIDLMMIYCAELADKIKLDFKEETKDILESLLFDAKRRGRLKIFSNDELMRHFHLLDIRGTIRATLKIFNEDPDKYTFLEPLGIACRYQYDLEDFNSDIAAGYVNIPLEEFELFKLSAEDLNNTSSENLGKWFHHRAEEGMRCLNEHRKKVSDGNFSLLSRATFSLVYVNPARKIFKKVLRENEQS